MEKRSLFNGVGMGESMPVVPIVEIAGRSRVLVENHKGVLAYSDEQIQIRVHYGRLAICGNHLQILQLCREQLVITGTIDSVALIGR